MKQYQYTTNNGTEITITQKELKLKQHLKLVPLLLGADAGSLDKLDVKTFFKAALNQKVLFEAIRIIAQTDVSDDDLGEMPDSVLWEFIDDFLSFNPRLKKSLGNLFNATSAFLIQMGNLTPIPRHSPSKDSSLPSPTSESLKESVRAK